VGTAASWAELPARLVGAHRHGQGELGCSARRGFAIGARDEGRAAGVEPNGEEASAAMAVRFDPSEKKKGGKGRVRLVATRRDGWRGGLVAGTSPNPAGRVGRCVNRGAAER
jgi:hypothetical protein